MKKSLTISSFLVIVTLFIVFLFASFTVPDYKITKATTGGLLTFTIRTVTDNGTYSPKHVLAIWVEDANGFVKTRKAMANQRKQYLYTWKAASNYNVVDAITGPTLTSHQTHTVAWNCTDLLGNIVPDGDYTVWVEFTGKHAQGPLYNITFAKGPNAQSFSPADQTYFKDIQLDFIPYVAEFTSDVTDICQGEIVTFTDQSVGATSWSWNFGAGASPASAITAGPHNVTYFTPGPKSVSLTINGSVTETKQNMISVNASPTAEFSFSGIEYSVEFLNGSGNATSYLWDFGDGNTNTENNPSHTYASSGTYIVMLTATYMDCNDIITHEVSLPMVGTNDQLINNNEAVTMFPNPSAGLISIRMTEQAPGTVSVTVFNTLGKIIHESTTSYQTENQTINLDLSNHPKGIYFIKIGSNNLKANKKIMLY
jgi:PKD repeat protein